MQESKDIRINEFKIGTIHFKPNLGLIIVSGKEHALQPRLVKLFCYLIEKQGDAVGFDELMQHAWDGAIVSDVAVHRAISKLRQALNDDPKNPRFIETIVKKGYRLMVPCEVIDRDSSNRIIKNISSVKWNLLITLLFMSLLLIIYYSFNNKKQNVIPQFSYLTTHEGLENDPRFAPDNKSFVYTQINGTKKLGGSIIPFDSATAVLDLGHDYMNFIWSADGKSIFTTFRTESKCELVKYIIAEATYQKIADCVANETSEYAMDSSVDGHYIVSSQRDFFVENINRRKLYITEISSGNTKVLFEPPKGQGDFSPRYSADGKNLAFLREINTGTKELMLYSLEGQKIQQLTYDDAKISGVDWVSDYEIIFSSNKAGESALWLYDLESNESRWLNVIIENLNSIDVSNNGQKLLFQTKFRPYNFVKSNLNEPFVLTDAEYLSRTRKNNIFPSVSPDKKHIAYVSDKTGRYGIWLKDINKKNDKLLAENVFSRSTPSWSPDSTQLAYVSIENGQRDICLLNLDGDKNCILVSTEEKLYPTWSNDGKSLYFTQREIDGKKVRFLRKFNLDTKQFSELNNIEGLELRESISDKNFAYYIDIKQSQINELNLETLDSKQITTDMKKGYFKAWVLVENGIYYIDKLKSLKFINFKTQQIEVVNNFANIGYTAFSSLNMDFEQNDALFSLTLLSSVGDIGIIENFAELIDAHK